jgi:hypothetical protein
VGLPSIALHDFVEFGGGGERGRIRPLPGHAFTQMIGSEGPGEPHEEERHRKRTEDETKKRSPGTIILSLRLLLHQPVHHPPTTDTGAAIADG